MLLGPGFDGRTITVGEISTFTHPVWGQIGKVIHAAIEARVATINRNGGIAGKYPIRLIFEDAEYDPVLTASKIDATRERVAAYVSILGTPNVAAVLAQLDQAQIVASPASQDAEWSTKRTLMPVFNTYQVQAINGIAYYLEQAGNAENVVCAASVQTGFGDTGTEGFRFAQQRLGFRAGPVATFAADDNQPLAAIGQLRAAGCGAVLVTAGPRQTGALVVGSGQIGFRPRWIVMGASFSDRLVTPQTGVLMESTVWVVGDGTAWGDPQVPAMAALTRELIDADHRFWTENPDVGLTFGYAQARVLEALLEKAVANGDLSRAGLQRALTQLGPVPLDGLGSEVNYSASPRLSSPRITVFAVDGSMRNALRVLVRGYGSAVAAEYRR